METLRWVGDRDGRIILIDQTKLPDRLVELSIEQLDELVAAIQRLSVRGAPAIGVAAAYGVCLATRGLSDAAEIQARLEVVFPFLDGARPTAVNLHHMVARMKQVASNHSELPGLALRDRLLDEARRIHQEDVELCLSIGEAGAALIPEGGRILTHCNAGALATAGQGTALSVLYAAHQQGRRFRVFADETRPLLQGARLIAWELKRTGIPVTVICDNAAGYFFGRGEVDLVITGADRIAANGDTANKIGTYGVACLAHQHGV
ncbi:MAG: S-methyl-5-thioribose-1-phosphate isomerase, partial [Planctomycetota bacterium]